MCALMFVPLLPDMGQLDDLFLQHVDIFSLEKEADKEIRADPDFFIDKSVIYLFSPTCVITLTPHTGSRIAC